MSALDRLIVCPLCRGALAKGARERVCLECRASYPVVHGIPVLLGDLDDVKRAQAAWFDSEVDREYEIERPLGTPRFHAWLLEEKFRRSVSELRPLLAGAVVASVCAGSGMDAEFLARAGARVLAFDVSLGAAQRAAERSRRRGIEIVPVVADAERLPLRDLSVDVAYVHDGLHHLERPKAAIAEMARVARRAISVTEPALAAATRVSIAVGYSGKIEEAGNEVGRLTQAEVAEMIRERGFEVVGSERYAMVYRHEARRPVRLCSQPVVFPVAKAGFRLLNVAIGRVGNKLAVQAIRPDPSQRRIVVHDYAGHPFPVQLSRELARRGYGVLHLHCASYPNGRGPLERLPRDPLTFASEPVLLRREMRKYSLWSRPLQEIEYGLRLRQRLRAYHPEVVISGNTPLIAQTLTLRATRSIGAHFVFWQQDIHGLAMAEIATRKIPLAGGLIAPLFPALERRLLRSSDAIVPISDAFLESLRAWGVEPERIAVIENWAPVEELPLHERENPWRYEHGLNGEPLFLYSGTLGLKHDCDLLFQLARTLGERGAKLVVASQGLGADALAERLAREPNDALLLVPFQPYERLAEMLGAADVLISLLDRWLGAFCVPSKVLTYHCAGRPILAAMPAENPASRLVTRVGSGVVVEPEERDEFLAAAIELLEDSSRRSELGRRARAYAEHAFAVQDVADRFEEVLRRVGTPMKGEKPHGT